MTYSINSIKLPKLQKMIYFFKCNFGFSNILQASHLKYQFFLQSKLFFPSRLPYSQSKTQETIYQIYNFSSSAYVHRALSGFYQERNFSTSNVFKIGGNKMLPDSPDSSEMKEIHKLLSKEHLISNLEHQVLVIQPYIKWGPDKKRNTTPDLMLNEAVALVKSISHWKVVDKMTIGLKMFSKGTLFGSGNISNIFRIISSNPRISAVFISIDKLSNEQYYYLTNVFNVPVYDRYSIVIQIFREHAVTPEAKLQVEMAELPYILGRHLSPHYDNTKKIIMKHQKRISNSLEKLLRHRELTRKKRLTLEYPVIAVVGYTNAGKTSLIKALTRKESLTPKNCLFATLDVTMHQGFLPSNLEVLFVDTIGFIADIPIELIEPFQATLEDAMIADLIIHVLDVSHPNHAAQYDEVIFTLKKLNLRAELLENMITVANKIDLITHEETLNLSKDFLLVSASKEIGLKQLLSQIEKLVIDITGRIRLTIKVKSGGMEEQWLRREAAIISTEQDLKNPQHSFLKTIITPRKLDMFRHRFISSKKVS